MRLLLSALFVLLLTACSENNSKPYLMDSKQASKTLHVSTASSSSASGAEVARIEKEATIAVQKLKNDAQLESAKLRHQEELAKAGIQKEIALEREMTMRSLHHEESSRQQWWLLGILAGLGVVLFFVYQMFKKQSQLKMQMQHEQYEHEKTIKEQELRADMASKILDTLASGKVNEKQQERLLKTLDHKPDAIEKRD